MAENKPFKDIVNNSNNLDFGFSIHAENSSVPDNNSTLDYSGGSSLSNQNSPYGPQSPYGNFNSDGEFSIGGGSIHDNNNPKYSDLDLFGPSNLSSEHSPYNPSEPYTSNTFGAGHDLTNNSLHAIEIDGVTMFAPPTDNYSFFDLSGDSPLLDSLQGDLPYTPENSYITQNFEGNTMPAVDITRQSKTLEFKYTSSPIPMLGMIHRGNVEVDGLKISTLMNFEASKIRLATGDDSAFSGGSGDTLFYIDSLTGSTLVADATISKFGPMTGIMNTLGLNPLTITKAFTIIPGPDRLDYQDTVLELAGYTSGNIPGGYQYTPTDSDADSSGLLPEAYRGNAFQVLGDNAYINPVRYEDLDRGDKSLDLNLGYLPSSVLLVKEDLEWKSSPQQNQQINFGTGAKYPYHGFLDRVQNEIDIRVMNPISNWIPGSITFKDLDINIWFKESQMIRDLRTLKLYDLAFWEDWNINIRNPFEGLKLPEFPDMGPIFKNIGEALLKVGDGIGKGLEAIGKVGKSIYDCIRENKLIKKIGQGLGWVMDKIVGWGKKIRTPDWMREMKWPFQKLRGPNIDWAKIGNKLKEFGEDVAGGIKYVGGVIGDAVSYIMPEIGIDIGNLNPIESFELAKFDLKNPLAFMQSAYGGEAFFKNRAGVRTASYVLKPNKPADLERSTGMILDKAKKTPNFGAQSPLDITLPGTQPNDDRQYKRNSKSTPYSLLGVNKYSNDVTGFFPDSSMNEKAGGDRFTNAPVLRGSSLSKILGYTANGNSNWVESSDNGMPFYFKDLRDNSYIILRAYITGLTETISPTWGSEKYLGRSEPVYMYENTERQVSFNLNLAAQTGVELDSIYTKIRKLTSLTYPEYQPDVGYLDPEKEIGPDNENLMIGKMRMSPPLMSFRVGELYGSNLKNQLGFIDSLTYTFPDNSPWEFRYGQRVPKIVEVGLTLKLLHRTPPEKATDFYGYYTNTSVK